MGPLGTRRGAVAGSSGWPTADPLVPSGSTSTTHWRDVLAVAIALVALAAALVPLTFHQDETGIRLADEIAARLGIGPKTVESHLRRLFERFDLASRTELATRALREGWLEVPPAG